MNILYISNKDPRLTSFGSEQRTNLLWEGLKRHGRVYTFLLDDKCEFMDGQHPVCKYLPIVNKWSLWYIFHTFVSKLSPLSIFYRKIVKFPDVTDVFKDVKFDVVVARYVNSLCSYKYWEIAPLLIDIDDHPYQVYNTITKKHLPFGLKILGKYITKWQTDYIINKSVGGWIANQEQLTLCAKNYEVLPNVPQMPSREYKYNCPGRKNLFSVGFMKYGPNRDGVSFFLTKIWPLFHQEYPDVHYYIVGKGAPDSYVNSWNHFEGVKYLGYVENLDDIYEKVLAAVVPIYSGGGTCIKTLESMAYSRPCLSTRFGARGLPKDIIENERGVLLFNDAESFIKAYKKVQDSSSRQMIESQGKDVIKRQFSVDSFYKWIDKVLSSVEV